MSNRTYESVIAALRRELVVVNTAMSAAKQQHIAELTKANAEIGRMRAAIQSFLKWENEKPIADRTDTELLEQTELLADAVEEK